MTQEQIIERIQALKAQTGAIHFEINQLTAQLHPRPPYNRNKLYPYTKRERFAVASKLPENRRHYTNFRKLYETKEAAEQAAIEEARTRGGQWYVIEIQSITNYPKKVKRTTVRTASEVGENS